MGMDFAEQLKLEVRGAHAVFHEFAMLMSRLREQAYFFFFEGDEDPAFYMGYIHARLAGRSAYTFVCDGRAEVLKAHELVQRDGRGSDRAMFFVDKDHSDIAGDVPPASAPSVFQTTHYSIENYLVCEDVFKRFWTERLHLPVTDSRLDDCLSLFRSLHGQFVRRSRLLMALVLIGRGVDGRSVKLNLNNVKMDKVMKVDCSAGWCLYARGAGQHFLLSSSLSSASPPISGVEVRRVCRKLLRGREAKTFVRGKFELWFFWKFLTVLTRHLSDKSLARESGKQRATPTQQLSLACCVESLSPLTPCPPELLAFLSARIPLGAPA